jgi:hypothetical protein
MFTIDQKYGAYGTHSPVLMAINHLYEIKTVIEFGIGETSTEIFLKYYSNLEKLISFEHNKEYILEIQDPRWELIYCDHTEFVKKSESMYADLVFVDSGPTMNDRIGPLSVAIALGKLVVVHDHSYIPYAKYYKPYKHKYIYERGQTIVLSNEIPIDDGKLESLIY